jgi:hypothetical protein
MVKFMKKTPRQLTKDGKQFIRKIKLLQRALIKIGHQIDILGRKIDAKENRY